jgi:hypothetical protein
MKATRHLNALIVAATLVVAGGASGEETVVINSAPAAETLPAPLV